jgi:hypothetical protein
MSKINICLILLVGTALAFGGKAKADLLPNWNSKIVDNIQYEVATDKAVYDLGETVNMMYRITNLHEGPDAPTITYSLYHAFDFKVDNSSGETNWIWSADPLCSFIPDTFELGPGESKTYPYPDAAMPWGMVYSPGGYGGGRFDLVPPGNYDVSGKLVTFLSPPGDPPQYLDSIVSVPIQIVPEPSTIFMLGFGGLILIRKRRT